MVQVFLGFLRYKLSSIFGFTKTPFADGLGVAHLLATIHILSVPNRPVRTPGPWRPIVPSVPSVPGGVGKDGGDGVRLV